MAGGSRNPTRKRAPGRRPRPRQHAAAAPSKFGWRVRTALFVGALAFLLAAWATLARAFAPAANTDQYRVDAIIVLGYPADDDGNPTPEQLARVTEGVHEYERGVAQRLILTGGAAHNRFVEADVMARSAAAQGIPAGEIIEEPLAQDTIQNACYATRIMRQHGWHSAEVISAASHLPRAGLIFDKTGIAWRAHAAPPLQPHSSGYHAAVAVLETIKTLRYLVYAQWAEKCAL